MKRDGSGMSNESLVSQLFPIRQIIKNKTIGRTEKDPPKPESSNRSDGNTGTKTGGLSGNDKNGGESNAQKEFSEYLEKNAALHYLEFEVMDDAGIVQIRVINSDSGTIVRKIPPDNVVNNAADINKKLNRNKRSAHKLDIKA